MQITLINKNYLLNHKYFIIPKILGMLYFLFLLRITGFNTSAWVAKSLDLIHLISGWVSFLIAILWLVNHLMYSKIGHITLLFDKILIEKNGWHKTLNLNNYKKIRVRRGRGKEYTLLLDNSIFHIELTEKELESLKNYNTIVPISIDRPSIIERLQNFLKRFSRRNKDFMDDANRL